MANRNFEQVVLQFLKDRLVQRHLHRLGACHLVEKADLTDGLENHVRASLLLGCNGDTLQWLGMEIGPGNDTRVPEAMWLQSAKDWDKQPLDLGAFKATAINAFRRPIFASAQSFESGTLVEGHTKMILGGVNDAGIDRTRQEPGTTIWVTEGGVLKCVEGNARMHALALGLLREKVSDAQAGAWSMWVGR